ncbi:metallophosphoesterase [Halegenticoccus soli]|uniref:metallophosphoesterase n=1 Tax=Halegenticoccus soli TaxID=1985678 RepID=UPI000C6DE8F8|nr:metallophosphoesterase [Halegenticoccus soli]
MKLGVVSDTHDNLDLVEAAVEFFEDEGAEAVIHCGDVVAPFSAQPFDAGFDFYYVRGNNDGEWALRSTVESFGTYLGHCGALGFDGVPVAAYHGTNAVLRDALVDCGDYDYVLHGHTHERAVEDRDGSVRVNPGGLPIPDADDAFHVATIDTERDGTDAVEHHRLE